MSKSKPEPSNYEHGYTANVASVQKHYCNVHKEQIANAERSVDSYARNLQDSNSKIDIRPFDPITGKR
jgi:hypothetical protein